MSIVAYAIGYLLTSLVPNWVVFRIAAVIVVLGLSWTFLTLFQVIPPVVANLVFVAALSPGWLGAASGLLVRAYTLQQPGMTLQTRIVYSVVGFVLLGVVASVVG